MSPRSAAMCSGLTREPLQVGGRDHGGEPNEKAAHRRVSDLHKLICYSGGGVLRFGRVKRGYLMVGAFRLFLALLVVLSHTNGYPFDRLPDPGIVAVVTFFFVSGFLMPATFETNYASDSFTDQSRRYLTNRFLRIFPMYWVALAITLAILPHLAQWRDHYVFNDPRAYAQNIVLLGINQAEFWKSDTRYIGAAWTLDIELQFYLLVPFMVWLYQRAPRQLLIGMAIVAAAGICLLIAPTGRQSIDRTILPYAVFFFAGAATYLYRCNAATWSRFAWPLGGSFCALGLTIALFQRPWSQWLFAVGLIVFASAILSNAPGRPGRLDKALGDLSYPLFILHPIVIQSGIPASMAKSLLGPSAAALVVSNAVMSILFALAIDRAVSPWVERLRARQRHHAKTSIKVTPIDASPVAPKTADVS